MRSLFWKIFLSFWLAMTLIAAAFGLIYFFDVPYGKIKKVHFIHRQAIHHHGLEAASLLRTSGPEQVAARNRRFLADSGIRAYLFRDGAFVGGPWTPPPLVKDLARRAAAGRRTVERKTSSTLFIADALAGEAQGNFVVVGAVPHPSPLVRYLQPRTLPVRMLVMFLVAGLICYVLARYFTRSLRLLRKTAHRLAEGDLNARVGPEVGRGGDEIAALGRDFDSMAERIGSLLAVQGQLVRDISHELRSPLARLNVALGLARQKAGPQAGGHLDRIEREAERLNDLIGELMTLSLLESGGQAIEMQSVDLSELVRAVVHDADYEARHSERRVEVDSREPAVLNGQAELLSRAVENVVRNAVRFTRKGTAVQVHLSKTARADGPWATIRVRDHGPGVPEAQLDQIFLPFVRVDDARERQTGGTGIGLAITERAVKLHGGTVEAKNAPEGGLVVTITLPLSAGSPEQDN